MGSSINSPIASKINWTQIIAMLAMLGTYFGFDLDAKTQAAIVVAIASVSQVVTFIFRTWFTEKT